MQSVEPNKVFLRSVDGGLADTTIRARAADGAALTPASAGDAQALGRLLSAVGAAFPYRVDADASDVTDAHRAATSAAAPSAMAAISLRVALPAETSAQVYAQGYAITRVRSFDPLVRSRLAGLDLAIVTPVCGESENAGVPQLKDRTQTGTDVDDAAIDLACRYALRFRRRRVQILQATTSANGNLCPLARRLDRFADRYPDLELEALPVADVVGGLVDGRADLDVVVAAPVFADILRVTAATVSGAPGLVTELRFSADAIIAGTAAETRPGSIGPRFSALMLSAADLLEWLGRDDAARRLRGGWARCVESGCHTSEFSVVSPCARELDAGEFADALIERLGEPPRTLRPRFPGADAGGRRAPARLRLVRNSA